MLQALRETRKETAVVFPEEAIANNFKFLPNFRRLFKIAKYKVYIECFFSQYEPEFGRGPRLCQTDSTQRLTKLAFISSLICRLAIIDSAFFVVLYSLGTNAIVALIIYT